jgi:hypothetical protein
LVSFQTESENHCIEQLAGFSNKRHATTIFFSTGRFPDKHTVGRRTARTKHGMSSRPVQRARLALIDHRSEFE